MSNAVEVVSSEEYAKMSPEQKANALTFEQRAADIALAEKKEAEAREREKQCPYEKWAQVNLNPEICKARRQLIKDCPSAMVILEFLMEQASNKNSIICSQAVLSEILGYDKCTVSRSLKVLKERRFIKTVKSGYATVYLFNRRIIWKSWGNTWGKEDYEYGRFETMVLVGKNEQDKETLEMLETPVICSRTPTIKSRKPRKKDSQQLEEDKWKDSLPDEGEPPEE